jgi:hypothetical protein
MAAIVPDNDQTPAEPGGTSEAEAPATDPAAAYFEKVKARWLFATGAITFLMATIGPAIAFDITLSFGSDTGSTYTAFFSIVSGGLLLLSWNSLSGRKLWPVLVFVAVSVVSFLSFSIARERWSCPYQLADNDNRIVIGTQLSPDSYKVIQEVPHAKANCTELLLSFGGSSVDAYLWNGLIGRFLALYGIFVLAWLSLAAFLLSAVQRSLRGWSE